MKKQLLSVMLLAGVLLVGCKSNSVEQVEPTKEVTITERGADEIEREDEYFTVYTKMEDFAAMQKGLEEAGIEAESAELQRIPNTTTELPLAEGLKVMKLINLLEEDDDVQAVYHTLEMTDELMENAE